MVVSGGGRGPAGLTTRRVLYNTVLNFGGHAIPLAAGLVSIPVLISALGASRFGVLTLAWMTVGYFSLFDLGLGRALTKLVAERVGTDQEPEVARLAWTALSLMTAFGVLGAGLGIVLASWLTTDVLRIPAEMQVEAKHSIRVLALSLPVVITSVGLRSLLEARHWFGWVNALRIPTGVFTFAGPLLVLPFSTSLVAVVSVLLVGRVIGWCAHLALCARAMPDLFRTPSIELRLIRPLLGFGGWMTVTNIVGPVMVYMDRILIGSMISVAAVAFYATPYEVITKMWLVPGALLGVLFPAFSAGLRHDPEWVSRAFRHAMELLLLTLFPAALLIVLFAEEGLGLWLGAEFATQSASVARWLAVGVFLNSLAQLPFTLIQAGGRPDVTGKLHLVELPLYAFGLWWLTSRHGIQGAAVMWTVRAGLDAAVLFAVAPRFLAQGAGVIREAAAWTAATLLALGLAALPISTSLKVAYVSLTLVGAGLAAWKRLRLAGLTMTARDSPHAEALK